MILGPTEEPQPHESSNHFKGKIRVAQLLEKLGAQDVEVEKWIYDQQVEMLDHTLDVSYRFDVFCTLGGKEICVEIDGTKGQQGHFTSFARYKNRRRDNHFEGKGVVTIRFPTPWVWGVKALPDETIIDEIFCSIGRECLKGKFSN